MHKNYKYQKKIDRFKDIRINYIINVTAIMKIVSSDVYINKMGGGRLYDAIPGGVWVSLAGKRGREVTFLYIDVLKTDF